MVQCVFILLVLSLTLHLTQSIPVHIQGVCAPSSCTRTSDVPITSAVLSLTNTRHSQYACRNEEVTFNCDVINGISLQWVSEPHIPCDVPISYSIGDVVGETKTRGSYRSHLVSVTQNPLNSSISSNLTFTANGSVNSVTVACGDQLQLCNSAEDEWTLNITGPPVVPRRSLQYFTNGQEICPNISVAIEIEEIEDIALLTYKLNISSSTGCVLQECPMLLKPGERILNLTLMDGVNYTAMLIVSNDCGSASTSVSIQPVCEATTTTDPPETPANTTANTTGGAVGGAVAGVVIVVIISAAVFTNVVCYGKKKKDEMKEHERKLMKDEMKEEHERKIMTLKDEMQAKHEQECQILEVKKSEYELKVLEDPEQPRHQSEEEEELRVVKDENKSLKKQLQGLKEEMKRTCERARKEVIKKIHERTRKLLYKKSEEELLGHQEVTVQTHAESTAMTAGYLRGLDVTGETSILVTNQVQTFHWVGYGLKLHIPQGTLPAGLEKCRLQIKVGLSGHFKLPKNSSLVSAVYWLDSEPRCKFSQPITVEMQHCVKPSHTSRLSFVCAKCSQVQLPYDFKAVEGGAFSNESAYGCVQLYHFSLLGLIMNFILPEVVYCASLYYLVNQREIHFVITKNLEPYITVIQRKYRGAIVGPDLLIEFESDKISLPISLQGTTLEDGWKVFPLIRPVITKKEVDSFKPGQRIPSCQLKAEWTKESKPPRLTYPVTLDGARKPSNYFCIDIDWDSTQPVLHYKYNSNLESEPDLSDLMNKIAAKIPSKWKDIGLQLGVDLPVLDGIATISLGDLNNCYINVFTRWKNQNSPTHHYTWSTLVQALKKPAVGEDRLADEIKNELTRNQL